MTESDRRCKAMRVDLITRLLLPIHKVLWVSNTKGGRLKCPYSRTTHSAMNPMSKEVIEPYFFNIKQVTQFLGISASTYQRREKEGLAPKRSTNFGRSVRYPRADVILFAQGNWKSQEVK